MEDALSVPMRAGGPAARGDRVQRPPTWLIAATAALTFLCLAMAVAETTLWMHYLIDQGEYISLAGLAFILAAGVHLYRRGQLVGSLPLVVPWLLYPVITQGDQLIDNLTINQMRVVCQVLLALLFGAPVAVVVLAARYAFSPDAGSRRTIPGWAAALPGIRAIADGRQRAGAGQLAALLFLAEIWVAYRFLGVLMVATLAVMAAVALAFAVAAPKVERRPAASSRGERFALALLLSGVAVSLALFLGYKNRPGAYQGSPAYYMDPSQRDAEYPLRAVPAPDSPPRMPADAVAAAAHSALTAYGRALQQLIDGYYVADRNYNYAFHNALFLRNTPVLPNFRRVALEKISAAARTAAEADAIAATLSSALPPSDPLGALLADVKAYVAFNFRRAAILEAKTAEFERTKAGLQHATHIYEGEGKVLGVRLMEIVRKHQAVTGSTALAPITGDFVTGSHAVYDKYARRIVGF